MHIFHQSRASICPTCSQGLAADLARIPDSKEIAALLKMAGFSDIGTEICYQNILIDEKPERYLDKDFRNSSSTFASLTEEDIERGCERIKRDIRSGAVRDIVQESEARIANEVGDSCIVYGRKVD